MIKVLYLRAFFNALGLPENILTTLFTPEPLTKGFHKGPKSHFFMKIHEIQAKMTDFWVKIGRF